MNGVINNQEIHSPDSVIIYGFFICFTTFFFPKLGELTLSQLTHLSPQNHLVYATSFWSTLLGNPYPFPSVIPLALSHVHKTLTTLDHASLEKIITSFFFHSFSKSHPL